MLQLVIAELAVEVSFSLLRGSHPLSNLMMHEKKWERILVDMF